jgi:hypothetical protein
MWGRGKWWSIGRPWWVDGEGRKRIGVERCENAVVEDSVGVVGGVYAKGEGGKGA